MTLEDLLSEIPSDTRGRVERAKTRFNATIRDMLRKETALRLSKGDEPSGSRDVVSVPVRLLEGLPQSVRHRVLPDDVRLPVLLGPHRRHLEQLRDGAGVVRDVLSGLLAEPALAQLVAGRERHLPRAHALAEDLLREAGRIDLVAWILEVDEDVLGAYFYPLGLFSGVGSSTIDLYWGVIGLCAGWLGVDTEDLAVVVLAHELAHPYTHLGFDIDGESWATPAFARSEHALKEGLAQYYTEVICHRLARQHPSIVRAYATLVEHQPQAYRVHLEWAPEYTAEEVRQALLVMRRGAAASLAEFESYLTRAKDTLRRNVER